MTSEDADELDLYAMNTGELYPQRKAIVAAMRKRIEAGKYSAALGWKLWLPWFDKAARGYAREIDANVRFSRAERVKAAKERAKEEYDRIMLGEHI